MHHINSDKYTHIFLDGQCFIHRMNVFMQFKINNNIRVKLIIKLSNGINTGNNGVENCNIYLCWQHSRK